MKEFEESDIIDCLKYVISDVDDTITKGSKLYPSALQSLYDAKDAGLGIILVTGGSAGWADAYIRQWPVDAVIAESGAVLLARENGKIRYFENPILSDGSFREKRRKLMSSTGALPFSSDQYARLYDVAYEVDSLTDEEREYLLSELDKLGFPYLESSIHINVLMGEYDKGGAVRDFMPELVRLGVVDENESFSTLTRKAIAFGDSLNDSSLFAFFPYSIGNMNVYRKRDFFSCLPAFFVRKEGGDAFGTALGMIANHYKVVK